MIKKTAVLLMSLMLSAVSVSCYSPKIEEKPKNSHEFASPAVTASDGNSYTLPCSNVIPSEINENTKIFAEKVCQAAGKEYSQENLDSIWFGENIFGAGLAAVVFFGKGTENLSSEEWQIMADIAASPEKYNIAEIENISPLMDSHAQYVSRIPESAYFDAMTEEIISDIVAEKGCSRNDAFEMLYSEGVQIKTPYSPAVQKAVDEVYSDPYSFSEIGTGFPQSACAVCGKDGNIIAVAGGNNGNTAYNRSYRTLHRIGSAVKPLSVYTPAISSGMLNFSSIVKDEPLMNVGTSDAWPQNYNRIFEGDITLTYALGQSKNTVPVRLVSEIGVQNCFDFMQQGLGFSTLVPEDNDIPAMALGYFNKGLRLTELAAAYEIFGNSGIYVSPSFYSEVTDSDGNIIVSEKRERHQAASAEDAWIMNRLLYYNICKDDGIAQSARLDDNSEVCGKTGTVDNDSGQDTDRIFVGLTPEYSAAVWIGYDEQNAPIVGDKYEVPASIWKKIMERTERSVKEFTPTEGVIEAEYCTVSGGLAGENCKSTEKGYYREDNLPKPCLIHE